MIKVLIVDDDKLVRKGLISAMPWSEYGMEVVGEAYHGERALELLDSGEVEADLLLTDLAMPIMSGIDLMRAVTARYPRMEIVVLTLHQDFEYIQEALRLGAIDYIAKVQLEQENFDEVLGRIARRIQTKRLPEPGAAAEPGREEPEVCGVPEGRAFLALRQDADSAWLEGLGAESGTGPLELDRGMWLWLPAAEADGGSARVAGEPEAPEGWALLVLDGLLGAPLHQVERLLRDYREHALFYDYAPGAPGRALTYREGARHPPARTDEALSSHLKAQWASYEWLHSDELFLRLLQESREARLPESRLIGLLYSLVDDWNRMYSGVMQITVKLPESLTSWHEIEQWITETRKAILQAGRKSVYSPEVIDSVMSSIRIIHEELDRQVTAVDVARRVAMSRSYFSQCFKDIAGRPFNEYLRGVRMDKAKEYLLHTNKPILWIAENTGYLDEKYFSRTFRELTGMLPSEFRLSHQVQADVPAPSPGR